MEAKENCLFAQLKLDEACVTLASELDTANLWLYTLSADCVACPYTKTAKLDKYETFGLTVNTARSQSWRVIEALGNETYIPASNKDGLHCQLTPSIGQHGIYEFTAHVNKSCELRVNKEPDNPYIPLAIGVGLLVLLLSSLSLLKLIRRCIDKCRSKAVATVNNDAEEDRKKPTKRRVRSLDTVRGMSILLMIFVNNGAAGYVVLEHATWNGLLVGDLVFPCFMWIMGVCIPLSISAQLSRGSPRLQLCRTIVKRSVYLFAIGLALNTLGGRNQLERIRIFGVLQRFGVAYLVAGIVYALAVRPDDKQSKRTLGDVVALIPQWIVALLILAAHCAVVFMLPVPGCPKGYLGPGGRHADGKYWNCSGGATGYVDKVLLGVDHIYQLPTANSVYGSGPFDPEGVLGSLTSIFQVFLGIQAGQILRTHSSWKARLVRWLLWSVLLGSVGATLHYTNVVPVNKNLWSISFVLVTTCFSLGLLSLCYLLIDVVGVWDGGPFRVPGMNALVMYAGHQILYDMFPFHWRYGPMNSHTWLLAESLWCVGLWTLVAYGLHRKKLYVAL